MHAATFKNLSTRNILYLRNEHISFFSFRPHNSRFLFNAFISYFSLIEIVLDKRTDTLNIISFVYFDSSHLYISSFHTVQTYNGKESTY